MWKTLVVLAIAASTFIVTPTEGTRTKRPTTTRKPCSEDTPKCPKNETLDPCLSLCPPRQCGVNIAAVLCLAQDPDDCKPGCRCKDGYLRNAEGFCILEDECPKCTNPNEVYDVCPNPCPPRRCDVDDRVIRCAAPPKPGDPECQPGCRCADGYVRNNDGQCVTRDQCPKCTRPHEIFDDCPSNCPPQTCESIGKTYHCPLKPTKCPKGKCVCEPGYYRNILGECISEENCLKCNGTHEYFTCGGACDNVCATLRVQNQTNCPIVNIVCNPMCYCEAGYARDENNICVPFDQCKILECGKNEIISECPPYECRALECSQVGFPVDCPEDRSKCPGKPACICDYGYARDSDGKCIPINECPSCGGDPNAVSGCGVNCGRHCSDLKKKEPVACIEICYINGCDCKDGYYFDDNTKKCVCPEECTPPCGEFEVYSTCTNGGCGPWTCADVGFPTGCVKIDPKYCKEGCVCQEGYVRENGTCIPSSQCPSCGGDPNATPGCGINCGRLCSNYNKGPVACPAICINNACDCKKEYVYDENTQKCVLPEECTPVCGEHEVFSECVNGGCQAKNCSQLGKPVPCVKPRKCKPGCLCADGYLRADNGTCIPKDQCPPARSLDLCPVNGNRLRCAAPSKPGDPECQPGCRCADGYVRNNDGQCVTRDQCPKCTRPHEIFDDCPSNCPPQTCESIGKTYHCPLKPTKCPKGKCVCEPGYYRNILGECISEENCLKCNGTHEYFTCGGACDNVCATLRVQNQTNCPIVNIVCNPMCYCEAGYARDENNICVPFDQCKILECGKNEIISECPPYECRALECSQVGFPVDCPEDRSKCPGKPACICDYGYARDSDGKCISINECPSCGGDPNAVLGCGVNCGRHCSDLKKKEPVACIEICYINGCDCKDGYYFDDNTKKCVCPEECTPPCGEFEVYSTCTNGGCGPWTCADVGFPTGCVKIDPKYCKEGCVCQEGYVRENGTCIPSSQCPSCGGDPNATPGCGINCGRLCSNYNKGPVACPAICINNACDCKKEYVYDENTQKCVLPEECTPVCGENEVFSECVNGGCQAKNCSQLGKPVPCVKPRKCKPGCLCADGYLRADNGTCILKDQCPQKCTGSNEIYDPCPPICPPQTCESIGQRYFCPYTPSCKGACRCKSGYFRNKIGECISEEDCKPQCGENERLEQCPDWLCSVQSCKELGFPLNCPELPSDSSTPCPGPPKCVCDYGYVRDENGKCIPEKECPSCGGDPNAESGCGLNCGRLCSNYDKGPVPCPRICFLNACDCKKDYVYDENLKKCVLPEECTPTCGSNEVYDSCANGGCGKRNCSQLGQPDICIDVSECIGACVCKEGYLRAKNGTCIPQNQCPKPTCGKNERFVECPDALCAPQTCSQLGFPVPCLLIKDKESCPGQPACICDNGYVRNDKGICIPKKQCPSCGGDPNAVSGCGVNCGRLCSNYDKGPVPCPKICKLNGCDCKKDYVLDLNTQKCVRPKDCTPICGDDEVYSDCINGGCQAKNCSQLGKPVPCVKLDPKYCIKGCLCKEGYLRADNGKCVPEDQCNTSCNKPHEYYDSCAPSCPPQTCESIGRQYKCPLAPQYCKGACRCEKGYYRNKIGECISEKDCLKCNGPHEYFSCGGACDNVCSKLSYENQTNCPIINIKCNPMCYCEEGYARDDNNICVPIDKCPVPECGPDEVLDQCPASSCSPLTCSQLGFPISCPALSGDTNSSCPGPPGCICSNDRVRDINGDCIPRDDCPSCGGDPNAVSGCGIHCGNLCSNYKSKPRFCPLICLFNSCDCRKGYVYDQNLKKCVLPENCTPTCEVNEVYDTCANGGCQKRNCSQVGEPQLCIDPITCIGGCVCAEGYLRAQNGSCIPENQCPVQCRQPNEIYDDCPPICPPQTCESIGKSYSCPAMVIGRNCTGACRCKKGYYRNKIGQCISEEDCLKCTGPNEFFSCGGACDNVCETLSEQNQTNCPIINIKCNPMCYCEEGYARNDEKVCIPIDQCPASSCGGDPNAVPGCGVNCGRLCSNYKKKNVVCPLICKIDGCDCKDGYVFDTNLQKCVRPKDCTPICRKNEVYNTCANGGCDKRNCSQLNQPDICIDPIKCIGGCVCQKGYLKADNGTCVPADQCPIQCIQPHEVLDPCPSSCPPQTCDNIGKVYSCPKLPHDSNKYCSPACRCEDDYYRNVIGECISKIDCLKCTGPNEYFSCGVACDNECATLLKQNQTHCPIINKKCNPKCYCYEGYARNNNNVCIPIDQCEARCTGANEVFSSCPVTCPPQTCDSLDKSYVCPIVTGQEPPCNPGCICREGYYRSDLGECVTQDECRRCTGANELFSNCPLTCPPQTCDSLDKVYLCPIEPGQKPNCNPGCTCRKGYYRNNLGACVSKDECSAPCGPNERYEKNPSKVCEPLDCSEVGFPLPCPPVKDPDCQDTPACICKRGYVRNKCGDCIPPSKCPSCGGDPNAVAGCGINCGRHCSDYGQEVSCIAVCYDNACDCKDGFVYDDIINKCVRYEDCTKTNTTTGVDQSSNVNVTEAREQLERGNIALSGEFLYQSISNEPDKNFVASSFSLVILLAQLGISTVGSALSQILNLLNLQNKDQVKGAFPVLINDFKNKSEVIINIATIVYANDQYPLSNNFKTSSEKYFDAGSANVDFSKPVVAANTMNTWISNHTGGKITDLISPDMLNADTRLILINAIYFKGNWVHQFNPNNTQTKDFYKSNGDTVSVQMMYQQNSFNYAENDKYQVLQMFYKDNEFSFLAVLPKQGYSLTDTAKILKDPEVFQNMIGSLSYEKVQVSIPKMLIKTRLDLVEILNKLNVTAIFDPNNNEIQGILEKPEPLYVSKVVQGAYLDVNELGSEAAAATAIIITRRNLPISPEPIYIFNANHPFLFYIAFEGTVLFCGAFVE